MIRNLRRAISNALVRTTTVSRAFPKAKWSEVLPSESIEFSDVAAPPFEPAARYLDPTYYMTPPAITAPIHGAMYYSYLNVLMTPWRSILLDSDNVYLEHPDKTTADIFYWRDLYFKPVEEIPGVSFVLRSPANNFYHTLVDNLPRLYALHQPRYRDTQIAMLVPGALRPFEDYFLSRMLPDNVRIKLVEPNRLYRLETVVFSSYMSRQLCGYLPRHYLSFFRQRTLPSRPRERRNRIYITRQHAPVGRRILNETELLGVIQRYGFRPYALEGMSLPAQIELFFDAEAVIAPHGAGLTNLLFADRVGVVELHPTPSALPHYYFLSQAMAHKYRFVCSNATTRHSDFTVDIDALIARLGEALDASESSRIHDVSERTSD